MLVLCIVCALLTLAPSSAPSRDVRLVAHWRCDETAGSTVADAVGGLPGKLVNPGQVMRIRGRRGQAVEFAGGQRNKFGCIVVDGARKIDLSKGFTIEAWIRFSSRHVRQDTCFIASDGPWKGPGWRFLISYNNLFLQSGDGQNMWGAASESAHHGPLENGRWYHVAGTFDGSFYRVYLDGVEVGVSGPKLALVKGSDALCIGSYAAGTDSVFNGAIDEVKLWTGARSHLDIVKDARLTGWGPRK